jgi:prepilin-type N-terminal cleavage/methylation domain-containing protein
MKSNEKAPSQRTQRGFTLLELLVVVAIMGVLMMVGVASFVDIGRGAAMKKSVMNLYSTISHARQYAITKRQIASFEYGNQTLNGRMTGYFLFVVTNDTGNRTIIGGTNYTEKGIVFSNQAPSGIRFDFDGSCLKDGDWSVNTPRRDLILMEALPDGNRRPHGLITTTMVYRLTGRVKGSGQQ